MNAICIFSYCWPNARCYRENENRPNELHRKRKSDIYNARALKASGPVTSQHLDG